MCGIVGYIGTKDPIAVLIGGLEKLNIAAMIQLVAVIENAKFRKRSEGKSANLKRYCQRRLAYKTNLPAASYN